MSMKRGILRILVLGLLTAILVGCGGDDQTAPPAGATAAEEPAGTAASGDPIVIGAVVGRTGFMNPFDVPPFNAMKLAVDTINSEGGVLGRPLRLIEADGKSDKVQAGTAAAELLNQGAEFIVAPCDFDFGAAAAIEAQKQEKVGMSNCAGTIQFGVHGIGPYAFTMGGSAATFVAASAEWGHEKKGWRTAYVLQDDSIEFHKQGCGAFIAKWNALPDAEVLGVDKFQQDDPSISSQISRIRSLPESPDFIVLCSHPPGAITALRQIRAAGIDTPIMGEGESFDGDFWKDSVPGISDFYYASNGSMNGDDSRERVNELIDRYRAEHGELPATSHFLAGYSVIEAFKLAAERAGSTDGPAIREALESFRDEDFLVGTTTFTPEIHISIDRTVAILEIQDGETKFVELWKPEVPPVEEWTSG